MRTYYALFMLPFLAGCCSSTASTFSGLTSSSDMTVLFDDGKASLSSNGNQVIHQAADHYKAGSPVVLTVIGHSSSNGNENDNLELSAERAEKVKSALVQHGIPTQNIRMQAYGISEPVSVALVRWDDGGPAS